MRTLCVVGLLVLALLAASPSDARWESARDNKSPAALAAMGNQQLFDEAFDVCVRRALLESFPGAAEDSRDALAECNAYFAVLTPVVRERNDGNVPPWMSELLAAHTTKTCQGAFRTFLNKTAKPAPLGPTKAATAATAGAVVVQQPRPTARPKPTPAQPHSQWSEQLPPWIAPH
jgi:hypothetical protein